MGPNSRRFQRLWRGDLAGVCAFGLQHRWRPSGPASDGRQCRANPGRDPFAGTRGALLQDRLRQDGDGAYVRVLLHSLAFGTLLPYFAESPKGAVSRKQMDMTVDVMAHSLVYWAQELKANNLLRTGSRIFAMTSSGASRVITSYGAISAAKAALESHIRQLAFELAPLGIAANAIRAGVTDTPALQRIPGGPEFLARAKERNPSGRSTTPVDVARAIVALADERLAWMTGNVIGVDGGEELTA